MMVSNNKRVYSYYACSAMLLSLWSDDAAVAVAVAVAVANYCCLQYILAGVPYSSIVSSSMSMTQV